jgi:hypothetical protein
MHLYCNLNSRVVFRKQLENSLAQLNVEHVEVLVGVLHVADELRLTLSYQQNEIVKQRLKNEEMEEELVRYKLL